MMQVTHTLTDSLRSGRRGSWWVLEADGKSNFQLVHASSPRPRFEQEEEEERRS